MCHGLSLLYGFDGAQHVARTCLGKMTWNREQHCETADVFIHVYYLQQGGEAKEYFQERNSCQPEMCAESEAAVQDPVLLSAPSGAPGKKLSSLGSCKVNREKSFMTLMEMSLAIVLSAWPRRRPRGEDLLLTEWFLVELTTAGVPGWVAPC